MLEIWIFLGGLGISLGMIGAFSLVEWLTERRDWRSYQKSLQRDARKVSR